MITPWAKKYYAAKNRCKSKKLKLYYGLRFTVTLKDFERFWYRDKAYLMENPSIDRINPKLGYTKRNCRFLEWYENATRSSPAKKVYQFTMRNKFIKGWRSIESVIRKHGFSNAFRDRINRNGVIKSHGFIWRLSNDPTRP